MKALIYFSLLFLKMAFLPNLTLLGLMFFLIVLDFFSGVLKAIMTHQPRTSSGYRKTISKFIQYGGAMIISIVLAILSKVYHEGSSPLLLSFFGNTLSVFIIYIEITSFFENCYACDPTSVFSQYFFKPVLKVLTAQIKNNPAMQAAQSLEEQKTA